MTVKMKTDYTYLLGFVGHYLKFQKISSASHTLRNHLHKPILTKIHMIY